METPTLLPRSADLSAPPIAPSASQAADYAQNLQSSNALRLQALGASPAQVDLNPTSQYYQENTLPYQLGQWLSGRAGAAYNAVNPALSRGPLLAALGVGAAGLGGGYLARKAKNLINDEDEPGSSWAVPAGLAGLGLGAWLGYNRMKQAGVLTTPIIPPAPRESFTPNGHTRLPTGNIFKDNPVGPSAYRNFAERASPESLDGWLQHNRQIVGNQSLVRNGILPAGFMHHPSPSLKQASGLVGADPDVDRQQIQMRLLQDVTLDSQQRHAFVQAIGQLSDSQVSELSRIIGGLLGASVGAVVAKYLLHLGLFGTGVAAAAGGWLGSRLLARPNFQPTAVGTRGPAFSSYFGI